MYLKKTLWSLLWMWFNCLKARGTFYHKVPRYPSYSFFRSQKDERLSWSGSHPVVLNTGPLDWESSILITTCFGFENNWLETCSFFNKWIFVGVLSSTAESYVWRCSEISSCKISKTPRKHPWCSFFSQVESLKLENY